jgi:hypothetical protein
MAMHLDWAMVGVYAFCGLALLVVLWPTLSGAKRFLQRWGVPEPDEQQTRLALKYLRDRRLLYPPLFVLAPLAIPEQWGGKLFVPLVVALLVAEAVAALRPARGPRVARLTPRRSRDLVQRWAVGLMVALGLVAIAMAVASLVAQQWANRVAESIPAGGTWTTPDGAVNTMTDYGRTQLEQPTWLIVLVGVVVGLVMVLGLVQLALRRVSVPDPQADAALRTRSARVAVGIGIAWMASSVTLANNRLEFLRNVHAPEPPPAWLEHTSFTGLFGFLMLLIGAAGWYWVANPANRMPYVQSTT